MEHVLKIHPQYYARVADGTKTFEIRDNDDRAFQKGDLVTLDEWDPNPINPTDKVPRGFTSSPQLKFQIGYVHVLTSSQVVFSLLPLKTKAVK